MPYIETLIGQWLPIRLIRGALGQPWWLAGLVSAVAFTGLHGYTDRAALSIFFGATVLAAVFVIEARRHGRPVVITYLTHALANAFVLALRLA
jgi:membrane protease YdiL (CAAX protease family)